MSGLSAQQVELAGLLFSLPEASGFALAGGSALVALQLVDRATRDLDAFVAARPGPDPGTVEPLLDAALGALAAAGWAVEVRRRHPTFCRVVARRDGQAVEIDLAVDSPPLLPLGTVDCVPVLAALDLAARKVLAVLDRAEARDFSDLWALSQSLGRDACTESARQLDRGVTEAAVATAFGSIDRLSDEEFPVSASDVGAVRAWFHSWRDDLDTDP